MRLRHAALTVPLTLLPLVLATPAHALTCPLLPDSAGDAAYMLSTPLRSNQADIVGVDIASGAATVVAVMRVTSFEPQIIDTLGVEWGIGWEINGNHYNVQARHGIGPNATWIYTFTTPAGAKPVAFSVDVVSGTLTWTVRRGSLPDLATPGATFTSIAAATKIFSSSADYAHAAGTTYVDQSPGCVAAA